MNYTNTIDESNLELGQRSKGQLWAGYIIGGLPVLFLLMDGVMKLFKPSFVVEPTLKLGYSESTIVPLGVVLVICTILYVIPRTTVLGAILLTGYLGGAVATNVRVVGPAFNIVFPVVVGVLLWASLFLREPRLRSLLPMKS